MSYMIEFESLNKKYGDFTVRYLNLDSICSNNNSKILINKRII